MTIFRDRTEAGRVLAKLLLKYANRSDALVLALPRGGVPVGYEIAKALHLPLDVFVVRKLGVPGYEELAMGAVASGAVRHINQDVVDELRISNEVIEAVSVREQTELQRRERAYRYGRPALDVRGKTVILVDDGLATGATMRAAIAALRDRRPGWLVVAVPAGSTEACREMSKAADEVICATEPKPFYAVGDSYSEFRQTTDDEVRELLKEGVS